MDLIELPHGRLWWRAVCNTTNSTLLYDLLTEAGSDYLFSSSLKES